MVPHMETLDARAHAVGWSLARLGREAGVPYRRLWEGLRLRPDELYRVEVALQLAEERKTAPRLTPGAAQEVAGDAAPRRET